MQDARSEAPGAGHAVRPRAPPRGGRSYMPLRWSLGFIWSASY